MANGGPQTGGVPAGGLKPAFRKRKSLAATTTRGKTKAAIANTITKGVALGVAKANAKKKKMDMGIGGTGIPVVQKRSKKKRAY